MGPPIHCIVFLELGNVEVLGCRACLWHNLRIVPGLGFLDVVIEILDGMEPCAFSEIEGELSFSDSLWKLHPKRASLDLSGDHGLVTI